MFEKKNSYYHTEAFTASLPLSIKKSKELKISGLKAQFLIIKKNLI